MFWLQPLWLCSCTCILCFFCVLSLGCSALVVNTIASDWLERLVPEMTYNVLEMMLNSTHSLTSTGCSMKNVLPRKVQFLKTIWCILMPKFQQLFVEDSHLTAIFCRFLLPSVSNVTATWMASMEKSGKMLTYAVHYQKAGKCAELYKSVK